MWTRLGPWLGGTVRNRSRNISHEWWTHLDRQHTCTCNQLWFYLLNGNRKFWEMLEIHMIISIPIRFEGTMKNRLIFHDVKPQILDLKTQYGRNDSSKTDQGVMWFNTVSPWKKISKISLTADPCRQGLQACDRGWSLVFTSNFASV